MPASFSLQHDRPREAVPDIGKLHVAPGIQQHERDVGMLPVETDLAGHGRVPSREMEKTSSRRALSVLRRWSYARHLHDHIAEVRAGPKALLEKAATPSSLSRSALTW